MAVVHLCSTMSYNWGLETTYAASAVFTVARSRFQARVLSGIMEVYTSCAPSCFWIHFDVNKFRVRFKCGILIFVELLTGCFGSFWSAFWFIMNCFVDCFREFSSHFSLISACYCCLLQIKACALIYPQTQNDHFSVRLVSRKRNRARRNITGKLRRTVHSII